MIASTDRSTSSVVVERLDSRVATSFINEVSPFRRTRSGRWTEQEIELVRSDKLLSQEGVHIIERIPLATL